MNISDVDTKRFNIYTDGGSRGNPGPSAAAYLIYDSSFRLLETGGTYIGITTNNHAEYTAVLLALQAVRHYAVDNTALQFYIDSLLVVNQMNTSYKIQNRELWPVHQEIREMIKQFKNVQFKHIPREENSKADTKVNQILDEHEQLS